MAILPTMLSAEDAQLFDEEDLAAKLAATGEEWEKSRHTDFSKLLIGLYFTGRLLPPWLVAGLQEILKEKLGSTRSKKLLLCCPPYHEVRWYTVRLGREQGVTWDKVFKWASEQLKGTPAEGEPDTIRGSYKNTQRTWGPGWKMGKESVRKAIGEAGGNAEWGQIFSAK
jgi:hypothetical protein